MISFYSDLPVLQGSIASIIGQPTLFVRIPSDWHVIVTDIKESTKAMENGRHEEVNLIAAGCVIAGLNLAFEKGIEIPFFFGGDGATLLVPDLMQDDVLDALFRHKQNTWKNYKLALRVGSVPVSELEEKTDLRLARVQMGSRFDIPVFLGQGLALAEKKIKLEDPAGKNTSPHSKELNLAGMECRWNRISPGGDAREVISLLVVARDIDKQSSIFQQVMGEIETVYGALQLRNPVSYSGLRLKASPRKIRDETLVKTGEKDWGYFLKNWLITLFGKLFYMRTEEGKAYRRKIIDLTDTLVIDGRINTVIAGTQSQRVKLLSWLDEQEAKGSLLYGLYVSRASIMSCYVRDREDNHVHFVDGADGGYTMAAKMLKEKLAR